MFFLPLVLTYIPLYSFLNAILYIKFDVCFSLTEHSVRTEVMDQMPQIALFCHEESPRLDFVVPQHILPHIVRALTDHFTQVGCIKMYMPFFFIFSSKGKGAFWDW